MNCRNCTGPLLEDQPKGVDEGFEPMFHARVKDCLAYAIAQERERAAKIAEEWISEANLKGDHYGYDLMRSIAAKIREGK